MEEATDTDIKEAENAYQEEQSANYASRQFDRFSRLSALSIDPENQVKYQAKADEWKSRKSEYPSFKEAQEIIPRTPEEINALAKEMDAVASKHTVNESKWSGKVRVDDQMKQLARKEWTCDITTRPETSPYILLHELLHAHSASYHSQEDFLKNQVIEEGSTELLTQEIAALEKIPMSESISYGTWVRALRGINRIAGLYGKDIDFAKALHSIPMTKRLDWLNSAVQNKMLSTASIQQYNEVSKLLDQLITEVSR